MDFADLSAPVIAAPMAGGPSTPELVAAVSAAGGYAYLAAGYRTPEALRDQIVATRRLTGAPFGVNVFVPAALDEAAHGVEVAGYRARLTDLATESDVDLPHPRWDDTDSFADKIDLLAADPVDSVSFTFGCPGARAVDRLHAVRTTVAVTVTDVEEALAAVAEGADVVCVQGSEAGGHRSTHTVAKTPNTDSAAGLVTQVAGAVSVPIVAAGGVGSAADVRALLDAGATAVQVGTAFLLTDEAGTSAAHRAGLQGEQHHRTVVTRAFSGRPARGLHNAFIATYDVHAPAAYPVVDQVTKPLRAAAAARTDADGVSLWAGTQWRHAQAGPAADVVAALTP